MIAFRMTLDFYGEKFKPDLLHIGKGEYPPYRIIDSTHDGEYAFGNISFRHPRTEYAKDDGTLEYQEWYIDALKSIYKRVKMNQIDRATLFIEIFYDSQCNFEILTPSLLRDLGQMNTCLSFSVYQIDDIHDLFR